MGSCFSGGGGTRLVADRRKKNPNYISCANVVSHRGDLRQYPIPITASQVLQSETATTSSTPSSSAFFLCDSDRLYFDEYIPPLGPLHQLQPAQLYFVLPLSKLRSALTASDMAALAVKAGLAIQTHADHNNIDIPRSSRNNPARISPVLLVGEEKEEQEQKDHPSNLNINTTTITYNGSMRTHEPPSSTSSSSFGVSRGSAFATRKLQRLSSRRSKTAVHSFRIRLTTISEGSIHLSN